MALITSKDYPLSFFGRKIGWMKPDKAMKVLKVLLKSESQEKDLNALFDHESLRWSNIRAGDLKQILIRRIWKLYVSIRDFVPSIYARDIRVGYHSTEMEQRFWKEFYENKIAPTMELSTRRLSKRSYASKWPKEKIRNFWIEYFYIYFLQKSLLINLWTLECYVLA
jgi:hypothetical protein